MWLLKVAGSRKLNSIENLTVIAFHTFQKCTAFTLKVNGFLSGCRGVCRQVGLGIQTDEDCSTLVN